MVNVLFVMVKLPIKISLIPSGTERSCNNGAGIWADLGAGRRLSAG